MRDVLVLGCGPERFTNAINVDLGIEFGPDLVADARRLPFRDESFAFVVAHDLLEHFPATATQAVLGEWRRVLKPGGGLEVRVPNMEGLATHLIFHKGDPKALSVVLDNIYGGHKYGPDGLWDTHHTGFTPESLRCVLDEAGFETLSNTESVNMTVKAVRR